MRIFLLALFSGILVATTLSDKFAGNWNGKGKYSNSAEEKFICDLAKMTIYQDSKSVFLDKIQFRCDKFNPSFDSFLMNTIDGELRINGKKVGTYTENRLQFEIFWEGEGKETYDITLNKADSMTFDWRWDGKNWWDTIKATLKPTILPKSKTVHYLSKKVSGT